MNPETGGTNEMKKEMLLLSGILITSVILSGCNVRRDDEDEGSSSRRERRETTIETTVEETTKRQRATETEEPSFTIETIDPSETEPTNDPNEKVYSLEMESIKDLLESEDFIVEDLGNSTTADTLGFDMSEGFVATSVSDSSQYYYVVRFPTDEDREVGAEYHAQSFIFDCYDASDIEDNSDENGMELIVNDSLFPMVLECDYETNILIIAFSIDVGGMQDIIGTI